MEQDEQGDAPPPKSPGMCSYKRNRALGFIILLSLGLLVMSVFYNEADPCIPRVDIFFHAGIYYSVWLSLIVFIYVCKKKELDWMKTSMILFICGIHLIVGMMMLMIADVYFELSCTKYFRHIYNRLTAFYAFVLGVFYFIVANMVAEHRDNEDELLAEEAEREAAEAAAANA